MTKQDYFKQKLEGKFHASSFEEVREFLLEDGYIGRYKGTGGDVKYYTKVPFTFNGLKYPLLRVI